MRKKQSSCHPSFSLENVKGSSNYKINKNTSSLKPACQFGAMTFICLFPFSTFAECTPTPDCASIGYNQTSCEGDYLACPFDSTKLKCLPCDSSFRYDCTGDNITAGIGNACDGKYVSCECSGGLTFNNGICICPNITSIECLVGTIYYPNGKCSNDYVSCLNPVGVVVKDNELVTSWLARLYSEWGGYGTDIESLINYTSYSDAKADFNGKNNTLIIANSHINAGLTASNSAAIYCNEYVPTSMEETRGQWYLPAGGELYNYIYENYGLLENIHLTHLHYSLGNVSYWSSTEYDNNSVWYIYSRSSGTCSFNGGIDKNKYAYVTCFLEI